LGENFTSAPVLQNMGYHAGWLLAGAAVAEIAALSVFALLFSIVARIAPGMRPVQVSALALLAIGLIWFGLRLRS
jgi:hypothetical protein